jgi:hypothetical protein
MANRSIISTITVQNVIDFCRSQVSLRSLLGIGGITNEPGMTYANLVLQDLLAKPFAWKFNRKFLPFFVTQPYIQDYNFAGACAFSLSPVLSNGATATVGGGGVGIDLASNSAITQAGSVVTVNCLQRHNYVAGQTVYFNNVVDQNGAAVTALNAALTVDTNALSSTWSNPFIITATPTGTSFQVSLSTPIAACGAPGIFDFGWLESASLTDVANTAVPQPTGPIKAVDLITPTSLVGETAKVCAYQDLGTGIMVFRVDPCAPTYSMAVNCVYQIRAPRLISPRSTWAPWPDNLAFALYSGVKAFAFDNSDRSDTDKLKASRQYEADKQKAASFEDSEESEQGFAPSMGIMRG